MFSTNINIQGNNIVSATKAIVETHILQRHYQNYSDRIIKIDYNNSPLHNRINIKYNCDIDELPEGRFPLTI